MIHKTPKKFLFFFAFLVLCSVSYAQHEVYEKHWYIKESDTLPYRVLLPKNYNAKTKYPLIFFLHGAGERGNDNEAQLVHGSSMFLRDSIRNNYPAIVVFPQCPAGSYWSNVQFISDSLTKKRTFNFLEDGVPTVAMKMALKLLDQLNKDYKLDKKHLYVGGLSMGGMGTFELVRRKPGMFAAAVAICGGASTATAAKIKKPHWWIFHGAKDDVVPPAFSEAMANALKAAGADVKFTVYPDATHNSWDSAFAEKDLFPWLFSQHK